ncbi:MAG: hypothetical protein DRP09_11080 [Candidatus Thorarchaeota archaeon]|nr:MAG: hypothetical protein DRP09_11080 [Candidatus Thorarchaeota archaeon]
MNKEKHILDYERNGQEIPFEAWEVYTADAEESQRAMQDFLAHQERGEQTERFWGEWCSLMSLTGTEPEVYQQMMMDCLVMEEENPVSVDTSRIIMELYLGRSLTSTNDLKVTCS